MVMRLAETDAGAVAALLDRFGVELVLLAADADVPGSFWGAPEAGIIGHRVYARPDTPIHSVLHEACHLIVAGPERWPGIHTDATDCDHEEDATCYLQIVLADAVPGFGQARALVDMDAWGYSFRLGSARAWFRDDAENAAAWLEARGLPLRCPTA